MHISKVINETSLIFKRTIFNKAAIVGVTNNGEHFVAHVLKNTENQKFIQNRRSES